MIVRSHTYRAYALFISLSVFTNLLLSQTIGSKPLRLDEKWWNQRIHDDEREGFVAGYLDCRPRSHGINASYQDYIIFVGNHVTNSVPETIELASRTMKPQTISKGGETWRGPHGFLNGGYWGSGSKKVEAAWADLHRGYVEGYLACRKLQVTSSSVNQYVHGINNHYLNAKQEHDFIADVVNPLLPREKSEPAK
jgi:hypothetical protein